MLLRADLVEDYVTKERCLTQASFSTMCCHQFIVPFAQVCLDSDSFSHGLSKSGATEAAPDELACLQFCNHGTQIVLSTVVGGLGNELKALRLEHLNNVGFLGL